MSSRFITNRDRNTMSRRIRKSLRGVTEFDILVGYLNLTGLDLILDSIEEGVKVRVLVGMGVGQDLYDLRRGVREDYLRVSESEELYSNTEKVLSMLSKGDLEIKGHPDGNMHSKLYIFKGTDPSVIVGSSNLTSRGLEGNIELNVELRSDSDYREAVDIFTELWDEGVDLGEAYIDIIHSDTWVGCQVSPYELYMKFLYEYYKYEHMEYSLDLGGLDGIESYKYQIDGAVRANSIINKHGGVFISDVVGLGKTYTTSILLSMRRENTLVLCPPHLVDEWREVIDLFGFNFRCEVESTGKLDHVLDRNMLWNIQTIVIDESHSFKNKGTLKYDRMREICKGKNVVLLSATPRNNFHKDIENQLRLFQPDNSSILSGYSLSEYFRAIRRELNAYDPGSEEYRLKSIEMSNKVRDDILLEIMVRRTRHDIEEIYSDDLERQGLVFPQVMDPVALDYEIDGYENEFSCAYDLTLYELSNIKFDIYNITKYIEGGSRLGNVVGFIRTMLIKRFESSMHSFKKSLIAAIDLHSFYLDKISEGKVPLMDKDKLSDESLDGVEDIIYGGLDDECSVYVDVSEVDSEYIRNVRADYESLVALYELWDDVYCDKKWETFKYEMLTDPILSDNKVIVFTEYQDTADYLYAQMESTPEFRGRVYKFTGSDNTKSKRAVVRESFDYNIAGDGGYDILITTDVLSEGINLHMSNVVLNYDIPWNPTTVIQRVGRINRVGTPHDKLYIYNMLPTDKTDEFTDMRTKIENKLIAFQETLGEDAKYLSDSEVVGSRGLAGNVLLSSEELENLEEGVGISTLALKDKYKKELDSYLSRADALELSKLPLKLRSGKLTDLYSSGVLSVFRRSGGIFKYYFTSSQGTIELTFTDAVEMLRSAELESGLSVGPEYYKNLNKNKDRYVTDVYRIQRSRRKAKITKHLRDHLVEMERDPSNEYEVIKFRSDLVYRDGDEVALVESLVKNYSPGELTWGEFKLMLGGLDYNESKSVVVDVDPDKDLILSLELF